MSRIIVITGASEGIGAGAGKTHGGTRGFALALGVWCVNALNQVAQACGANALGSCHRRDKTRLPMERLRDAALERFGTGLTFGSTMRGAGIGICVVGSDGRTSGRDDYGESEISVVWNGTPPPLDFQTRGQGPPH